MLASELAWEWEWAKLSAWISSPHLSQNFQDFLCTPLPCSNTYCLQEVLRWLHLLLFPRNPHAGCSFRSWFHNRLDSHLYLGLKDWRSTTTPMWLQPPLSRGGVHWIATALRQRRPRARFYYASPRASRTHLEPKSRHNRSQRTQCSVFIFPGREGSRRPDYRPRQPRSAAVWNSAVRRPFFLGDFHLPMFPRKNANRIKSA